MKIYLSLLPSILLGRGTVATQFRSAQFLVGTIHWRAYYAHFLTQFSGKCNGWGIYANVFYVALLSDTFARKNSCSNFTPSIHGDGMSTEITRFTDHIK